MKSMQGFSLTKYMARRRKAARIAAHNISRPQNHCGGWLCRKLAFDREFKSLMRIFTFTS